MDLLRIYRRLLRHYGPQGWWPIAGDKCKIPGYDRRFEVIVGAILTQMVSWTNVEKALLNLIRAGLLSPGGIKKVSRRRLEVLIRPAGYYRQKAIKLKNFVGFLDRRCGHSLNRLQRMSFPVLRRELLSVNGIGEETADSIILYAFDRPAFVADTYTQRLLECLGVNCRTYRDCQQYFVARLRASPRLWNEYHALIVRWGKDYGRGNKKSSAAACRLIGARGVELGGQR